MLGHLAPFTVPVAPWQWQGEPSTSSNPLPLLHVPNFSWVLANRALVFMLLANLALYTVSAALGQPEGEPLSPLDLLSMMLTSLLSLVEWIGLCSSLCLMLMGFVEPKLFSGSVRFPNSEHNVQCVKNHMLEPTDLSESLRRSISSLNIDF